MQYTFCRLGMMFIALSLSFSLVGCEHPIYIEVPAPVEVTVETPEPAGGGCECEPVADPPIDTMESGASGEEQRPEITGFTFTQINPLRSAYAVKDQVAGKISNPIGGTAPFIYALVDGNGINDADNGRFTISGNLLKIQSAHLSAGMYSVCLGIMDGKGVSHTQAVTVTIAPDPIVLDQETRTVQRVNFKMRYIPSGAFMRPYIDGVWEDYGGNSWGEAITVSGFWIAETETTQELYQLVMGENPSWYKDSPAEGETQSQRPVDSVSWYESVLFCNRLSAMVGREPVYHVWGVPDWDSYLQWAISTESKTAISNIYVDKMANGYRLPTDNEWLWAAIGADTDNPGSINTTGISKYFSGGLPGSADGMGEFAWLQSNHSNATHEVGKKRCNELGIFDMTGNVTEWVWECFFRGNGSRIFTTLTAVDPRWGSYCGIRFVSNQ